VLSHGCPLTAKQMGVYPDEPVTHATKAMRPGLVRAEQQNVSKVLGRYLFHPANAFDRRDEARAVGLDEF
jgi:hypothetical protein